MRFMNEYDIDNAVRRWGDHPVAGPAARTLENLMDWTNRNSDGWPYWPKPCRSAAKLMELLEGNGTWDAVHEAPNDLTPAQVRKAYVPIKAFLTRQGVEHETVVVPV